MRDVVAAACSDSCQRMLLEWSTSLFPTCVKWLSDRSLTAPAHVLDECRRLRANRGPLSAEELEALPRKIAAEDPGELDPTRHRRLVEVAAMLARHVRQSAFPLTLERMGDRTLEVCTATSLIPVLSQQAFRLFLPSWLVDCVPERVFPPSSLFPGARPASTAWLLLDAAVLETGTGAVGAQAHYGFFSYPD